MTINRRDIMARFGVALAIHPILLLFLAVALAATLTASSATAQQISGEQLFRQRCSACHSLEPGQNRVGPSLSGVVGRTAGTISGARYSQAMRASGIVWNAQTLDTFLTAPSKAVTGSLMTLSVPDADQRAAIISFLASNPAK